MQSKQDNLLSWYKKYINPNEQESILNPPLLDTIPQHGPSYFTIPESYEIKRNQDDNWQRKWRQSIQWIFEDSVYSATFPTNIRDAFPFNTTAQQTHFTNPDSSLFCFFFGSCYVVLIAKQSPLISVPADASAYNALNETLTWYIGMSESQRKGASTLNRLRTFLERIVESYHNYRRGPDSNRVMLGEFNVHAEDAEVESDSEPTIISTDLHEKVNQVLPNDSSRSIDFKKEWLHINEVRNISSNEEVLQSCLYYSWISCFDSSINHINEDPFMKAYRAFEKDLRDSMQS